MQKLKEHILFIIDKLDFDKTRFLEDQYNIVYDVCENVLNKNKQNHIIDAPTGTGKSIIAIVSSLVLNMYDKKGYIITSDLQLQAQYARDIEKFKLEFGNVKGIDNYTCELNSLKHSLGKCHQRNMKIKDIKKLECYSRCQYYLARDFAILAETSVLNYSYWLIQQDYVNRNRDKKPFEIRDFCFFDECHKIAGIVQNHFAPIINKDFPDKMNKIIYTLNKKLDLEISTSFYNEYNNLENDIKILHNLKRIEKKLENLLFYSVEVKDRIRKKYTIDENIPKEELFILRDLDWLKDVHCKVEDYTDIIDKIGDNNIIKIKNRDHSMQFKNLDESHLMKSHFHIYAKQKIFMSATVGRIEDFNKLNSIKEDNHLYTNINSNFDFKKSEIFIHYPIRKMSYREKESSFPDNLNRIKRLLKYHKNDRGIIHTGSYDLTYKLLKSLNDKRIINYTNSKEKVLALEKLKKSKNGVLIGPSLIEGLDLYDDLSRFQIFLKVPYMSLADEYVKKRMEKDDVWYTHHAIIQIIQGIGRSIRNKKDYAKTYLIDGNFNQLIINKSFPDYILNRVSIIDDDRKKVFRYV